jgi:hypothetical protein
MNLRIDHARQNVQTAAIDHLAGGGMRQIAERRDAPARNAKIARALPVVIDDGTALENQIVSLCQTLRRLVASL